MRRAQPVPPWRGYERARQKEARDDEEYRATTAPPPMAREEKAVFLVAYLICVVGLVLIFLGVASERSRTTQNNVVAQSESVLQSNPTDHQIEHPEKRHGP